MFLQRGYFRLRREAKDLSVACGRGYFGRGQGYTKVMEYVEQRNGGYYVAGVRVTLDSVVYAYLRGESPEGVVRCFPALNLEQVNGAIAYYLAHRDEIDAYLVREKAEFNKMAAEARRKNPTLYEKLEKARDQVLSRHR